MDKNNTPKLQEAMRAYLKGYTVRPSCYSCNFKKYNRASDITLGDFWGINNSSVQNDDKGVSLIVINTDKGNELVEKIKANVELFDIGFEEGLINNKMYSESLKKPLNRSEFWNYLNNKGFSKASRKFCRIGFKSKMKYFIKTVLRIK